MTAAVAASIFLAAAAAVVWLRLDPRVPLLLDYAGASWVVAPMSPSPMGRPSILLESSFVKEVEVARVDPGARLCARGFRSVDVTLNGRGVDWEGVQGASWKRARCAGVARLLRPGTNEIAARVTNASGPPALWLRLSNGSGSPDGSIASGADWVATTMGSAPRAVRLASAPVDPLRLDPSLRAYAPRAVAFRSPGDLALLLCAGAVGTALLCLAGRRPGWRRRMPAALTLTGVGLWALLFWNDAASLSSFVGFDAARHAAYVRAILDSGGLPRADEGWAFFHPPLYHASAALLLERVGASTHDPRGFAWMRTLNTGFAAIQLIGIAGVLRELMPEHARARAIGVCVALALPLHLYLFQLPTNEVPAAAFCSVSLWLSLRALSRPGLAARDAVLLGACFGLALLSRLSTALVVASCFAALVLHVRAARPLALLGGVALAVGGWHYARLAFEFGTPFLTNWDPRIAEPFWQDPGYLTPRYYLWPGAAFSSLFWSGLDSFPAGIHSTLWADGLLSGRADAWSAPPWRLHWMAIGSVLALAPGMLALVGGAAALGRAISGPGAPAWRLVVAAAGLTLAVVAAWPLGSPSYAVVKAFFAAPAVACLCAFAALGFEALARVPRLRFGIAAGVLAWAAAAALTYWIPRDDPAALARLGALYALSGDEARAREQLAAARERGAAAELPRLALGEAELLRRAGDRDAAVERLRAAVSDHPYDWLLRRALARTLSGADRRAEGLREWRALARIHPDLPEPQVRIGEAALEEGDVVGAIEAFRSALAIDPQLARAHRGLAAGLRARGDVEAAAVHELRAESFEPSGSARPAAAGIYSPGD